MTDNFEQEIRRLEVTKEYHKAFLLCLENLKNSDASEKALNKANTLIRNQLFEVFEKCKSGYRMKLNRKVDENWLIDIAIGCGYKEIDRASISLGLFNSIPCIVLGSFLAKHKIGIQQNKDNTSTIYYDYSMFCDDFKMIKRVGEEILKMFQ